MAGRKKVDLKGFVEAAHLAAYAFDPNASVADYAACRASYAAYFVAFQVAYDHAAAEAAYYATCFAYAADADHAAEEAAQMEHLRELGNPFEEDGK